VRNANKGTIVKKLYGLANKEIETIDKDKERITTKMDTGKYEVRFHTMAELEYEAILVTNS
jgi:hypothetical protein